ncbi:preprotein translocase subunit YajC [Paracoccus aurantiacus]|uniref:Sec translocon accessory complex subunit YajC n=1 Tax=Paracoccus aurantiacus TaxID=2599412 RepID=A0A5C6S6J5_9RHOB|nr:preprotein translocase subunit YajC [Paracoccus aurantiacus]TXB70045.1 preprotein translocase subunit YajC [Paracoccus aurantiacus]
MFVTPAYAQAAGGAGGAAAITQFVPLILIFVIMYFLILRPQQKRMKEHRNMVSALKRGDQVVTQGGLIGKVTDVKDEEVTVEIAQGVKVRVVRGTIAQVVTQPKPAAANS